MTVSFAWAKYCRFFCMGEMWPSLQDFARKTPSPLLTSVGVDPDAVGAELHIQILKDALAC
jgi:hypothetical protein